jgi:hypothetical protein
MPANEHDQALKPRTAGAFLVALLVALILTAICAASASASAVWKFEGEELTDSETIAGKALENSFVIPGLTTKCELSYKMKISNSAGVGKGEITELLLKKCSTSSKACAVKTATVEKLPWPLRLTTVSSKIYVALEKIRISFLYSGEECALDETVATITGSAAGLFNNVSSTIAFKSVLDENVEWNCILTTEATGAHSGQALEVG